MLINELLAEDLQNEGIKQNIATAVFGVLTALGSGTAAAAKAPAVDKPPQVTTTVAKSKPAVAQTPAADPAQNPIQTIKEIGRRSKLQGPALEAFTRLLAAGLKAKLTGAELVAFISQCAHESAEFTKMHEDGDRNYFEKKYGPEYESLPTNRSAILGNNIDGDGPKFHGRGYIQLTGRENYTKAGKALGLDLVNNPELAADPKYSASISLWFWNERVHGRIKDYSDVKSVTKNINSKLGGLKQRQKLYTKYAAIGLLKKVSRHDPTDTIHK